MKNTTTHQQENIMEATTTTQTIAEQLDDLKVHALNLDMPIRLLVNDHIDQAQACFYEAEFKNKQAITASERAAKGMLEGMNVQTYFSDAANYSQSALDEFRQGEMHFKAARQIVSAIEATVEFG